MMFETASLDGLMNKQGVLSRKPRSHAEVKVGKVSDPSIRILDEAKPVQAGIGGHLGKAGLEHRLELAQPEERDQTQRHGDVFVIKPRDLTCPSFACFENVVS